MAITLERKNGGPYTKNEQNVRRNKVYALHFEKGYSAVKIAETINANRNTVNEDIKYWYLQISADFEKSNLPGLWALKQYNRLENQRGRLLDELEKQERLRDKLNIERMILDIDAKISDLAIKIGPIKNEKEKHEISEEQISNIVKEMIQGVHFSFTLKKEKILSEIIRITKSNQTTATKIFSEMEELGLGLDRNMNDSITNKYNILSFAELREYLSDDELENVYEQESKNEQFVHLVKKIQKYEAMYGKDRTKWPKEILDEITNEKFETLE